MAKRARRSVRSKTLESLSPQFIPVTHNLDRFNEIAAIAQDFGGDPYVRIYRDKIDGRKSVVVSMRYTGYRATIGLLPADVVAKLRWEIFWNSIRQRVISMPATMVTEPEPGVWIVAQSRTEGVAV